MALSALGLNLGPSASSVWGLDLSVPLEGLMGAFLLSPTSCPPIPSPTVCLFSPL